MGEKEEEKKETKVLVVNKQDIPLQENRIFQDKDKKEVVIITPEEALTEILETIRELKKKL